MPEATEAEMLHALAAAKPAGAGEKMVDMAVAKCGCIVGQEGSVIHLKACGPGFCQVQDEVQGFIEQAPEGVFTVVRHGLRRADRREFHNAMEDA